MTTTPDNQHWTLLLDFSNAFNNIDSQAIFLSIFETVSPVYQLWVESCFSGQPLRHFGKDTILSCRGVQQGDPLGPLGFALTLHPIVGRIKTEVPSLTLNVWYLDDGTLAGPPEALLSALKIIEEERWSQSRPTFKQKQVFLFLSHPLQMHRHLHSQTTFPLHVKDIPFSAAQLVLLPTVILCYKPELTR